MNRRTFLCGVTLGTLAAPLAAEAQQARPYRVGAILHGGSYREALDGARDELRKLGFEEAKQLVLEIRETKGDLNLVEEAAAELTQATKVDVLYTLAGSVTQRAARVTADTPIVFVAGSDPVVLGLVQSLARPGGRLTGVHFLLTDLTPKRLQLLKELVPRVRRVVTFYDPENKGAMEAARLARQAGEELKIQIVERHVSSVEDIKRRLETLQAGNVDAYFFTSDAMVGSHAQLIIDWAKAKRLPTMFHERNLVAQGGLASYGLSFREIGRLSAKYIARILTGTRPQDLPVERADRLDLVINLKTARALGLTIPQSVLSRADHVIQ